METLFNYENAYQFALQVGVTLCIILILSYFLSWIVQWVWSWLDDEEVGGRNFIIGLIKTSSIYKYPVTDFDGDVGYYLSTSPEDEGKKVISHMNSSYMVGRLKRRCDVIDSDGGFEFLLCLGGAVAIPLFIALVYSNFHISLCVAGFFALAFTTRGGRRLQKKLNKHIEDKGAHTDNKE